VVHWYIMCFCACVAYYFCFVRQALGHLHNVVWRKHFCTVSVFSAGLAQGLTYKAGDNFFFNKYKYSVNPLPTEGYWVNRTWEVYYKTLMHAYHKWSKNTLRTVRVCRNWSKGGSQRSPYRSICTSNSREVVTVCLLSTLFVF